MVTRQVFRRHVSWNTKSNKNRLLKTPGGRLTYMVVQKKASAPKCGDTKKALLGVPRVRPMEYGRLKNRQRKVARAYGGCLSAGAVRQRVVRAFLVEEQRCVKRVLADKARMDKDAEAPSAAKKKSKKKKN